MRNILLIVFLTIAINTFCQTGKAPKVSINRQFEKKDTTRTFTVFWVDFDSFRNNMILQFGTPVENLPGKIIWENINIPQLNESLKIVLQDGIWETNKGLSKYNIFQTIEEKENYQSKLKQNQYRNLEIGFYLNDKNIINNKHREKIVMDILDKIAQKSRVR